MLKIKNILSNLEESLENEKINIDICTKQLEYATRDGEAELMGMLESKIALSEERIRLLQLEIDSKKKILNDIEDKPELTYKEAYKEIRLQLFREIDKAPNSEMQDKMVELFKFVSQLEYRIDTDDKND